MNPPEIDEPDNRVYEQRDCDLDGDGTVVVVLMFILTSKSNK